MRHFFPLVAAALLMAASAASAAVPQAAIQPATTGGHFLDRSAQISASGYTDREFWISGLARTYRASSTLRSDGKWSAHVYSSSTPYNTPMLVRRPADPSKFNGIVIIEWLNVSSGYVLDIDWIMAKEEFLRQGYAYVGLTNQKAGLDGSKEKNPTRYNAGNLPNDDISYDVLSQAAKAVRDQYQVVLGGLVPNKIFATGHSQSALRLTTYVNAIHPLEKVIDGFVIHGRGNSGTKIASGDLRGTPSSTVIRNDLQQPVFQLQSEMDVNSQSDTSKATDSAKIRYWEVAGSSHSDQTMLEGVYSVSTRPPASCEKPANRMPFHRAQKAVYSHLVKWATVGTLPPTAPRITRSVLLGRIQRDSYGNALGGLRLPEIDVPIATYGIDNSTTGSLEFLDLFACTTSGSNDPFTATRLGSLYPTHADYYAKYKAAADKALAAGYLLPADYATALQEANAAPIPR
ncbi:alpha/beta hydrolase domain-containing protein [Sphaerotilaceae bacterium SBD11-9]